MHAMVQSGASGQEWAVLVALLRWQREGSNVLSMSVPTICKYTGLDEDTVRHRLSSLSKRYFVSAGGNEFPILEVIKPAGKGRTALYALCVPRLGPEDGSNMLTRKERVEWEKIRGNNGNAVFVNVVIAGISASDFRS
ncbi:MAG: hypothetical protein UHI81_07640 [Olegusella sp.]|nr:hypothetical protein [Olegusella sp.]